MLVDARDGSVVELEPNSHFPSWSPDGRYIAFWKIERFPRLDGFSLLIYDTLSGQSRRVLGPYPESPSGAGGGWSYDLTPRWSPDGRSLAFVSNRSGNPQAYLLQVALNT
jgi:Tol biopolymer transport system component